MYRTVETRIWKDPKIREASTDGKLFFLYLITNDYTHISGIYCLPLVIASQETSMPPRKIKIAYRYLIHKGMIEYDEELEIVWVKTMFSKQSRGEKHQIAAARHIETLHGCQILLDFIDYYRSVEKYIDSNVLDKLKHRVSKGHPSRGREKQKQKQKQKQKVEDNDNDKIPKPYQALFTKFHEINRRAGEVFPQPRSYTSDRKQKSIARFKEAEKHDGGVDQYLADFNEAVQLATTVPFYLGENDRGWRPTFDYFIRAHSNIYKVLERNAEKGGKGNRRDLNRIREMIE